MEAVMEQRVSLITLGVSDLSRAIAFYEDVLGWTRAESPPEIAFFDLNGVVFSLYPHDALAKDGIGEASPLGPYRGFALAHNMRSKEEVDALFAVLADKGANIVKPPEEAFWGGYSGYFADPDGHLWEVAYNPFWIIDANGKILMGQG